MHCGLCCCTRSNIGKVVISSGYVVINVFNSMNLVAVIFNSMNFQMWRETVICEKYLWRAHQINSVNLEMQFPGSSSI